MQFTRLHGYLDAVYGDTLPRLVWIDDIDPTVKRTIDGLNALGEKWASSLPMPSRPHRLSENAIRVEEILDRNERLRSLIRPSA